MARKTGSHSDITGPRVRAAALKLFAAHGFAAVSMRQIAAEVGVQAGALYLYTPDKQSLLFDLLRDHMQEVLDAWEAEEKPEGPVAQLETFSRFHIRFHLERPEKVFISYMELRNLEPDNFEALGQMRRQYENALEGILKRGQDEGLFDVDDTKLTTLALISMLNGVTSWYKPDGRLSLARVESIYSDMAGKAVRMPRWKERQRKLEAKQAAE
ncbi:TetR/AcrR family transcriptional regulator [Litoreibacter albidus]|uniref:Transcriptional regulator, TetR family n=1 Tax=Litoreibacter albidus TaxID=670155 RepID=A0A1H2Z209_9RHOB|nr:TetR/AcrR family transcriptional regulator [Litoreibacter albidus]SDX11371.1 transcriptional regulator, TetR family [Litoreibacter albidus]